MPLADAVLAAEARNPDPAVWIVPPDADRLRRDAADAPSGPLSGLSFAVKDNIDRAGDSTTAGCPRYAYRPAADAPVVARLRAAGAVCAGKTNLDQFATGLVGTRSPYGAPRCAYDRRFVSGGSSSGSAVAVARGVVDFALGTDTAGSGRVPAAFNHLVGLKPTRGRIPATGVVPACRSLDCVSVFARDVATAGRVLAAAEGEDAGDPYARPVPPGADDDRAGDAFRFGVFPDAALDLSGDAEAERLYRAAVARLEAIGGVAVAVDASVFTEAAALLYGGPWVAERYAAVGAFIDANPGAVLPVTRRIIAGGGALPAHAAFAAMDRLAMLKRRAAAAFAGLAGVCTPTTGTIYTVAEVAADPTGINTNLGRYTNFMNLLDLCGLALPAGFRADGPKAGTPFGVTLSAPAWADARLLGLGARYEAALRAEAHATPPLDEDPAAEPPGGDRPVELAVCGAHLAGEPLNHELTARGAVRTWCGTTTPDYRLYALAGGGPGAAPAKPGLVRVGDTGPAGAPIEVEVWTLSEAAFGAFVAAVPPPLAIGSVTLAGGRTVRGFVCEPRALEGARDITEHGGWRAYRAAVAASR